MSAAARQIAAFFTLLAFSGPALADGLTPIQCFRQGLAYSVPAMLNPKLRVIEEMRDYNRVIGQRLRKVAPEDLALEFETALDRLKPMIPQFNREGFLKWARENPPTLTEYKDLIRKNKTVGDVLQAKAARFEELTGKSVPLQDAIDVARGKVNDLLERCKANEGCYELGLKEALGPWFARTCMAGNPVAQRSMVVGLGIVAAGMYVNKVRLKQDFQEMPWDYFANAVLWSVPLTEIACRNAERASAAIGREMQLQKPTTFVGKTQAMLTGYFKTTPKSYLNYMIAAPLNEVTYMAFHTAFENMKGNDVDHSQDKSKFLVYLGWDAVFAVPLSVLVIDPVMMSIMPEIRELSHKLLRHKVIGEIAYNSSDIASRVEISSKRTALFQWFERNFVSEKKPPVSQPAVQSE